MNAIRSNFLALVAVAFFAACGDSPTGNGGENDRVIIANPSFATDMQEIFTRRGCTTSNCHGSSMQGGLGLASASASFLDLVNVTSVGDPNIVRVVPNDAVNSYLVQRLEGTGGIRMPQGLSALDNIDMTNITNWINTGAANN